MNQSSEIFYDKREYNFFDRLQVDVPELYRQHPLEAWASLSGKPPFLHRSIFDPLYRISCVPFRYRRLIRQAFRRIHLDLGWFYQFQQYWGNVLHGRPLWGVEDFFFLKNIYRMRFQYNCMPEKAEAEIHLQAWQQPELIYHLFDQTYRESMLDNVGAVKSLIKYRREWRSMLEFGAGTAPVTTWLIELCPFVLDYTFFLADIQTLPFHYAAFKFQGLPQVRMFLLKPEKKFQLDPPTQPVDAIVCQTVFEHLNNPLDTVRRLHEWLSPRGLLIFDYILSDANGLDTRQGRDQRYDVLAFIGEHFDVLEGVLDPESSMGITVARKRIS
jgi:SAM-dependent methyltransferase